MFSQRAFQLSLAGEPLGAVLPLERPGCGPSRARTSRHTMLCVLGSLEIPQADFTAQWKFMFEQLQSLHGEVTILRSQVIELSAKSVSVPTVESTLLESHGLINKELCVHVIFRAIPDSISSRPCQTLLPDTGLV